MASEPLSRFEVDGPGAVINGIRRRFDGVPPGTEVVVLTAAHYGALMTVAERLWDHLVADLAARVGVSIGTAALMQAEAARGTPLADVITEMGLTQEEIDGADDG